MDRENSNSKLEKPFTLKRKELFELARRSREGDVHARERLFFAHLDQVDYLVDKYKTRGVHRDDLYQDACYGLIMAIDRFDPDRGILLKTYAAFWIKKMLKSAVLNQSTYMPMIPKEDIIYDLQKYDRLTREFHQEHGRLPAEHEIADKMHQTTLYICKLRSYHYTFSSMDAGCIYDPPERADSSVVYAKVPLSKQSPSAEEEFLRKLHEIDLPITGYQLTKREEEVLCRRVGFNETREPETFAMISEATGWSTETVRTDYHSALYKLRSCAKHALQSTEDSFLKNDFSEGP